MLTEAFDDPIAAFQAAWDRMSRTSPPQFHPATVALATADETGQPSVRMVLLKGFDARGFVFYTNVASRKARELDLNPRGALCFFWHWLGEQVRIEGRVERASDAEADAYFATRPRGSQLGAWASRQSEPIPSRAHLEARLHQAEARFAGGDVPRPRFWGGFRLVPDRIEFWQEGADRLHDRLVFLRAEGGGWDRQRLAP